MLFVSSKRKALAGVLGDVRELWGKVVIIKTMERNCSTECD